MEPNINTAVSNAQAAVNVTPPGAVQSAIDFGSLGDAFSTTCSWQAMSATSSCRTSKPAITEGLGVAQLVAAIVGDAIEGSKP
jgi:hypothetical protein